MAVPMCMNALATTKVAEVLKEDFDLAYVSMFFSGCFLPHINDKEVSLPAWIPINTQEHIDILNKDIGQIHFIFLQY